MFKQDTVLERRCNLNQGVCIHKGNFIPVLIIHLANTSMSLKSHSQEVQFRDQRNKCICSAEGCFALDCSTLSTLLNSKTLLLSRGGSTFHGGQMLKNLNDLIFVITQKQKFYAWVRSPLDPPLNVLDYSGQCFVQQEYFLVNQSLFKWNDNCTHNNLHRYLLWTSLCSHVLHVFSFFKRL